MMYLIVQNENVKEKRRNKSFVRLMPCSRKMCSLQDRASLVKLFYRKGNSAPKALRRFRTLKNIHRDSMTANGILLELKDVISHHAFNIPKNLLRRDS